MRPIQKMSHDEIRDLAKVLAEGWQWGRHGCYQESDTEAISNDMYLASAAIEQLLAAIEEATK